MEVPFSPAPQRPSSLPVTLAERDDITDTARCLRRDTISFRRTEFFNQQISAAAVSASLTESAEAVVRHVSDASGLTRLIDQQKMALCSVGGFGAGTLAAQSDLDTVLLSRELLADDLRGFCTLISDTGSKMGTEWSFLHRPLSHMSEMMHEDHFQSVTSLFSTKLLIGSAEMLQDYQDGLNNFVRSEGRVLLERTRESVNQREKTFGAFYRQIEPNLKNARGGLRDLDTIRWLEKIVECQKPGVVILSATERAELSRTTRLLLHMKHVLHFTATSHAETEVNYLTRAKLPAISNAAESILDFAQLSRRMTEFYRASATVAALLDTVLQRADLVFSSRRPERISCSDSVNDRTSVSGRDLFSSHDEGGWSSGATLRRAAESGRLEDLIPAFRLIEHVPDYGGFHAFTMDEHALRTGEHLDHLMNSSGRFPHFPVLGARFDPAPLYLAGLLQNVMKPFESVEKDHYALGADVVKGIALQLGFSEKESVRAAALVYDHSRLANLSQRELVGIDTRVQQLADSLTGIEHLEQLFLLTLAHKSAANPAQWTRAKETWLIETYQLVRQALERDGRTNREILLHDSYDLLRQRGMVVTFEEFAAFVKEIDSLTLPLYRPDVLVRQYQLLHEVRQISPDQPGPRFRAFMGSKGESSGLSQLVIATDDRSGLLRAITARLAQKRLNLSAALVHTTSDGIACDSFLLEPRYQLPDFECEEIVRSIERQLSGLSSATTTGEMGRPIREFAGETFRGGPQVGIDRVEQGGNLRVEIVAANRIGLAAELAHYFERNDLQIRSAKLNTGNRGAYNLFVVRDARSRDDAAITLLRLEMLALLSDGSPRTA